MATTMRENEEELDVLYEEELLDDETTIYLLVVYNDEINTFMNVILSLMENCGLDEETAKKCTKIVHEEGACIILKGKLKSLVSMRNGLNIDGIDAEIEIELEK